MRLWKVLMVFLLYVSSKQRIHQTKKNRNSFDKSDRSNTEMSRRSNGSRDFRGRRSDGEEFRGRRSDDVAEFRGRRSDNSAEFRGRRSDNGAEFRGRSDGAEFQGRSNENGHNHNFRSDENNGRGRNETNRAAPPGPQPKLKPVIPGAPEAEASHTGIPAKEVVIANIPPGVRQSYIYDLCTKTNVNPLHVAMKTISRPHYVTIHYAYVYVKTDKDVNTIALSLNNLKLNGYQLIVASADKLAEEGKAVCQ